jgi:hypothetical protein
VVHTVSTRKVLGSRFLLQIELSDLKFMPPPRCLFPLSFGLGDDTIDGRASLRRSQSAFAGLWVPMDTRRIQAEYYRLLARSSLLFFGNLHHIRLRWAPPAAGNGTFFTLWSFIMP